MPQFNPQTMCTRECLLPTRVYQPYPIKILSCSTITSIRIRKHSQQFNATKFSRVQVKFTRRRPILACKSSTEDTTNSNNEDFVTRVLKENPSQVEPRFRIGDEVLTSTEIENLKNKRYRFGAFEVLKKLILKDKGRENEVVEENGGEKLEGNVYLKDILREFRGKLYVPEQLFGVNLSEEEEFDRSFKALPKMSYEEFVKFMRKDKVKLLTLKEEQSGMVTGDEVRDYIVELKETPGEKSLHRTRWAMQLDANQAQLILTEYTGPQYEIETRATASIAKLPEYPNPIASSISSRIMVEFGMVTVVLAAAAVVVGSFLASAVFAATSFVFVATVYIAWPIVKPFLKLFLGIIFGIMERVWDNLTDMFSDGGLISKISEFYTFGGLSASLEILKPISLVLLTMVLLVRFTLSRRPKNFKKWDIWQGIDFSQSKPQARVDGSTGVTFADVAGIEEAVEELQELVNYLKNPDLFDKLGIKPPHGVLLEGPPGCGKTLVAKAIAGEAGVPFYQMAGSEFVEVLVGVGSARIRDLFKRAKVNKPSVIFIDEIDALATRRQGIFSDSSDNLYNAATQERETTLNQLLIELDGFDTGKGVIFLGATNRMDLLDPALLRPGRFDRKIRVQPPNAKGRLEVLKVHARKVKMSPSVDLSSYANDLPGWTGAKLAQLLQEAALVAARKGHEEVDQSDLDDAVDRLTIGPKRVGIELGHQGQCRRATAEVGTAITSHLLRRLENAKVERCDRVSINPRGQTLSQVVFHRLDDELYMFERRPQLLHRLQVFLGGRAAEEVIYGRDTSRASVNYLADATWLARKIITIWNLENPMVIHGEPPPWRKTAKFVGPRLDFEDSLYDDYDLTEPPLNFNLDDEIAKRTEELLREMYKKTVLLLRQHHAALLKTVKVLLNQKEISGAEIDFIIDKYPAETSVSLLLEEEHPGSLPFFSEDQGYELEHALATSSSGELV
ncbi:probable inactive ATP-dependent zinc metalloprotease FTSHI 1, chloroplastic [Chenopodium quinoa]|uniref:probable inactive ATP-dependent zinc metalloprotease FTSHI 1, chloroplastic n=1 Tax=Chenopodium quinoa TaxID=63459 RepID=UPI000B79AA0E|nr:probable inactive ATP-dependent zinc metalloprotease FTSHI 1, chloroplastic [Chenopodium quinoa]